MSRRRHIRKKTRRPRPGRTAARAELRRLIELEDRICALVFRSGRIGAEDIARALAADPDGEEEIALVTEALVRGRTLEKKKGGVSLAAPGDFLEARISVTPRGNGFAMADGQRQDIYIAAANLKTATQGDRVVVRITSRRRRGPEGRVIAIVERANARLVGVFRRGSQGSLVVPDDFRIPFNLMVKNGDDAGAPDGAAVVAEITDYHPSPVFPAGRIIEVLGDPDDLGVRNDMVVRKHELPHEFSPEALREAAKLRERIDPAGREDLRGLPFVTIDGADARDFDDAVFIEKRKPSGWRLYVAIADVSHYVKPGSALDREAYARGTSVYFPGRVVPMLPERLSNDLCSLVPGRDRYTFTAIIDFDDRGARKRARFVKAVIRSAHRLTYETARDIVSGSETSPVYDDVRGGLLEMARLAAILENKRRNRGAVMLEIPEREIGLGPDGGVAFIRRRQRTRAHRMIEEFMLAANEAVASFLSRRGKAERDGFLYRVHEAPDPLKLEEFRDFAARIGIRARGRRPETWINRMLEEVRDTEKEFLINNLLLRSMQQARYDTANPGHFGLASENYTHFTSPIRRYPDLMVHRALAHLCGASKTPAPPAPGAGEHLSARERKAIDAEREMEEILQARYMSGRLGEEFEAVVSGVNESMLFIELVEELVSGAIGLADLEDDYYVLDDKNHRVVGRRHGGSYGVGDRIRVRLCEVDERRRRIYFLPVG